MRNIIFLDVDGVLNSNNMCWNGIDVGEEFLVRLKTLVEQTKAEIVLSSTWRLFADTRRLLARYFKLHNIPKWVDTTPNLETVFRHEEIVQWLEEEQFLARFGIQDYRVLIIDDDRDAEILPKDKGVAKDIMFIKTDPDRGFTQENLLSALEFFKKDE